MPDGKYKGRVIIEIKTVGSPKSPNYGLKKYEIELAVTEGEFKGKTAYYHRIALLPHNLATPPPKEKITEFNNWQSAAKIYVRKTYDILERCGVDISDLSEEKIVQNIAANNRRNTFVSFTMKNGMPYINNPVNKQLEDDSNSLFVREVTLPDGNDLPLV